MITITLSGDNLTTADLEWFRGAVEAAAGHSGNDYPIGIVDGMISVEIPGEEEEADKPDEPLKIGDRVRVLVADPDMEELECLVGKIGIIQRIEFDPAMETPYKLHFDQEYNDDDAWWVKSVERVSE